MQRNTAEATALDKFEQESENVNKSFMELIELLQKYNAKKEAGELIKYSLTSKIINKINDIKSLGSKLLIHNVEYEELESYASLLAIQESITSIVTSIPTLLKESAQSYKLMLTDDVELVTEQLAKLSTLITSYAKCKDKNYTGMDYISLKEQLDIILSLSEEVKAKLNNLLLEIEPVSQRKVFAKLLSMQDTLSKITVNNKSYTTELLELRENKLKELKASFLQYKSYREAIAKEAKTPLSVEKESAISIETTAELKELCEEIDLTESLCFIYLPRKDPNFSYNLEIKIAIMLQRIKGIAAELKLSEEYKLLESKLPLLKEMENKIKSSRNESSAELRLQNLLDKITSYTNEVKKADFDIISFRKITEKGYFADIKNLKSLINYVNDLKPIAKQTINKIIRKKGIYLSSEELYHELRKEKILGLLLSYDDRSLKAVAGQYTELEEKTRKSLISTFAVLNIDVVELDQGAIITAIIQLIEYQQEIKYLMSTDFYMYVKQANSLLNKLLEVEHKDLSLLEYKNILSSIELSNAHQEILTELYLDRGFFELDKLPLSESNIAKMEAQLYLAKGKLNSLSKEHADIFRSYIDKVDKRLQEHATSRLNSKRLTK